MNFKKVRETFSMLLCFLVYPKHPLELFDFANRVMEMLFCVGNIN